MTTSRVTATAKRGHGRLAAAFMLAIAQACVGRVPEPEPPDLSTALGTVELPDVDLAEPLRVAAIDLQPVPEPDLGAIETSVREQIAEQRAALDGLVSSRTAARGAVADAMGSAGMLYHIYEMNDAADRCYLNAEQLSPREFRWPYFLARLDSSRGRYDRAVEQYERALAARPDFVPALFWLADAHHNLGDRVRARTLLAHAARLDPSSAATLVALGQLALSDGDPDEAVERFESALELAPEAPSIHYGLAMAYRGLGRMAESRRHLERSAPGRLFPDDPAMVELMSLARGRGAAHTRAAHAMDYGRFAYAADEFQRLADRNPDDAWTRVNLGLARLGLGDDDAALAEFEAALRVDPDLIQAHLELARIHVRREEYLRAIGPLEAALRLDPSDLDASDLLGTSLLETARYAEAEANLRRVVEGNPGRARAHVKLAMVLCWTRRCDGAAAVLEIAHAAMPDDNAVSGALARLLAASPDPAERDGRRAIELIDRIVGGEAMDLAEVQTLAMAHASLGDFRSAVQWQERAVEAARRLNRLDLLQALEENLARYHSRLTCDVPWIPPHTAP